MDFNDLMKNAMNMKDQISQQNDKLLDMEFVGEAAGGAVKVTMNGGLEVTAVSIDPEVVDPDDITMTEDLLVVAFNDVLSKYNEGSMQQFSNLDLGGLGDLSSMLGL